MICYYIYVEFDEKVVNFMIEKLFVAKSGSEHFKWLPLWMHLEDTAGIMEYLLENFISASFIKECELTENELKKMAVFIAYTHDIGKATTGFQYKISANTGDRVYFLEKYGLKIPSSLSKVKETPHNLAGEEILDFFGCSKSIAAVVGAHHGTPTEKRNVKDQNLKKNKREIVGYENYFGNDESNCEVLKKAWQNIVDKALLKSGYQSVSELPEINIKAQMLLSGLLIVADWIASDTNYFPLIDIDIDSLENEVYPERVDNAWEQIKFTEMWEPFKTCYSNLEFKTTFGFKPSEIQREIIDIISQSENPGLFILEAPMGCGKTETALSIAELLATKLNKNGLFFGLPTQATANGIFPRIKKWAENQSDEIYHSIELKHGSASFNETFANVQREIPNVDSGSGLVVHSWFNENKKVCLADFVVATVDHMLMMALKRRHVMLLHLGMAEKVVVIDEVHAYDSYMNQYLERALAWLGSYGTPVILLSATLPSQRRMALVRAYLQVKESDNNFEENTAYPLLTWTDGNMVKQQELSYTKQQKSIEIQKCHQEDMLENIKNAVSGGGCVGVIMNTVRRAQQIADKIRHDITDDILLYHARYIMTDRTKKENELLKRIGKESTADIRKGFVVVGTQVLEQSLDIDFDLLITDICPMDLLLQRIGRLHRHDRDERPEILKNPVCLVITDECENKKTASETIYSNWLLKTTLSFLPDEIIIPKDISMLVQKVYNFSDESNEYQRYISEQEISKSRAKAFILKEPKYEDIHGLLERSVHDSNAEASVRDGISAIEVIAMKKFSDNSIRFLDNTPVSSELTDSECRRIAEQRLRLPGIFCQDWNIDKTIREIESGCIDYIGNWQNSRLLAGQLVLFFDENMETKIMNYNLKYSFENGLEYDKESGENERN